MRLRIESKAALVTNSRRGDKILNAFNSATGETATRGIFRGTLVHVRVQIGGRHKRAVPANPSAFKIPTISRVVGAAKDKSSITTTC